MCVLQMAILGAAARRLELSESSRGAALIAMLVGVWGVVGVHSEMGKLSLVGACCGSFVRAYECGMSREHGVLERGQSKRYGASSELSVLARTPLLAATMLLYLS